MVFGVSLGVMQVQVLQGRITLAFNKGLWVLGNFVLQVWLHWVLEVVTPGGAGSQGPFCPDNIGILDLSESKLDS